MRRSLASGPVVVVDYGMGNIGSVCSALELLGVTHIVSNQAADLPHASAIVLPGVGAFASAMQNLRALGLVEPLHEQVVQRGTPFLGICLGMQLLARDSVEGGYTEGLGWIDGHVEEMRPAGNLRVPHVGWNELRVRRASPLWARLDSDAHFYFDHSFHLQCDASVVIADCEYGGSCVAAVEAGNVFGVQFHPEKSQRTGLKLLRSFFNLAIRAAA